MLRSVILVAVLAVQSGIISPIVGLLLPVPAAASALTSSVAQVQGQEIDFNRDIRPILSNKCFACHGPDKSKQEAGLRLDQQDIATRVLESGHTAIVPRSPSESELIARVTHTDADLRMPPAKFGKPLSESEVAVLSKWIEQGAPFAKHWSYVKPTKTAVPEADPKHVTWPRNEIDRFTLSKMLEHGYSPSPEADRAALVRRVHLDLIGLPPTPEAVELFLSDQTPDAYERMVDRILAMPAFGEHWARQWLDLARYADSAGYADDPSRTIWAYRDWVMRSINNNKPFDQFTVEQIAGDLLPNPTEDQLIATAFHRNTLTNNEGGTNDEEFRNVAIVDRVNTTIAVWMGTTMACAQCHDHKYDPISQEEYFRVFAILNNTQDADRRDESPILEIFTDEQKTQKQTLLTQISELKKTIDTPTDEIAAAQVEWESQLKRPAQWENGIPSKVSRTSGGESETLADGTIVVAAPAEKDTYSIDIPVSTETLKQLSALRLEAIPDANLPGGGSGHGGGNFVITQLRAQAIPVSGATPVAKFVRIEMPGAQKILSLAEVQIFSGGSNLATAGKATQSTTDFAGPPEYAIDGNTDGAYEKRSVTHTAISDNPWWELELSNSLPVERITLWNRTDNGTSERLNNFSVTLLNENREIVWQKNVTEVPSPSADYIPSGIRDIGLLTAIADHSQENFPADSVVSGKPSPSVGWAVGGAIPDPHSLVVIPRDPISTESVAAIRIIVEQNSDFANHILGRFRIQFTADDSAVGRARLSRPLLTILDKADSQRSEAERQDIARFFRERISTQLNETRATLAAAEKQLAEMKPATSVPVFREMADNRRVTKFQYRGNYLDQGPVVTEGVPAAFHPMKDEGTPNRLSLAKWLVDPDNPLTARVLVNRYWETLFGRGIVLTSEEFGSQGELPTHQELLDWLSADLVENGWNTKELLKRIVCSATYRQSSKTTPEAASMDPDNRWLARGPRVRMSAEMIRDQALFVSGLLSSKLYGPPVNPPQPSLGLSAAFGSSTDWNTSTGEDRYRRAIYTTWRRSNPYPSMATFDAPNREVCTIRRNRTNTPLQSLVTLNDPVYVEAAQSLARSALKHEGSLSEQLQFAFVRCLQRAPEGEELSVLVQLFEDAKIQMSSEPDHAAKLATDPLGPLPEGITATDAAAMTVVANVLLNLDEMFLKR
ncbi:MAG: DUF1553 domain-containing protein [Planctomyces sp.]|nr:DUF1553 domain-containing protein [Planctomyces sp.]